MDRNQLLFNIGIGLILIWLPQVANFVVFREQLNSILNKKILEKYLIKVVAENGKFNFRRISWFKGA